MSAVVQAMLDVLNEDRAAAFSPDCRARLEEAINTAAATVTADMPRLFPGKDLPYVVQRACAQLRTLIMYMSFDVVARKAGVYDLESFEVAKRRAGNGFWPFEKAFTRS